MLFRFAVVFFAFFAVARAGENWTANQLVGTGREPLPCKLVPFFPQIEHLKPVDLEFVPGSDEAVVVELDGKIFAFSTKKPDGKRLIADFKPAEGNVRLYNLVFASDFPKDARTWVVGNHRHGQVGENFLWQISAVLDEQKRLEFDLEKKVELLRWTSKGHDGADLKFSRGDGMLYVSTGDGEPPADPANVGQKTDNLLGSILRIDVSDPENPIRIPRDNPFLDQPDVPDEVWAYGLRNPWRMGFHPDTHELFLGDNGDENWELVRRITRATNHGWSAFEGSVPFRLTNELDGPVKELTVPVVEHPHTEMRSVIGGLFYAGSKISELAGHYFYGCYFTGKIWAFEWDGEQAINPRRVADLGGQLVSFAEEPGGEIIVIDHQGPMFRLEANPAPPPAKPIPATLSETGIFSETENLAPARGVLAYEISAPAWQDDAEVARHVGVALQNETDKIEIRVGERQHKSWRLPNGSALAQTISHDGKRSETRVIHKDGGEWQFLSYRWRDDQSEADLVPAEGLVLDDGRRFPSRAECSACHTQRSFFALGFSTSQLNISVKKDGKTVNQLDWIVAAQPDWFKPNEVNARWNRPPALPNPRDENADLDARARAYLHVNCAHCHRESGLGGRAQFQLLHWLSLEETGAVGTAPLVGLSGMADAKNIAPGDPGKSEILRRMEIRGAGQMPLLDTHAVDEKGAALIREWIEGLE